MSLLNSMGRCFSVCYLALLILRQKNPSSDIVSALFLVLCGESESFLCASGICVPRKLQCNGYNDCDDWSDEAHCSTCRAVWGCPGAQGSIQGLETKAVLPSNPDNRPAFAQITFSWPF